jgi:hypothetical protein
MEIASLKHLAVPKVENDFYAVLFNSVSIDNSRIKALFERDDYFRFKFEKFKTRDISKDGAEKFKSRPSFRGLDSVDNLLGSIYTATVESRNNISYNELLEELSLAINNVPYSRRLLVRFSNPIEEYITSELSDSMTSDMTCLSYIHYMNRKVVISFRANDVENEMFYDFALIYWFFLRPIYRDKPIDILMNASTAQNVSHFIRETTRIFDFIIGA